LIPSRIWGLIVQSVGVEVGMIARDINIFLARNVRGNKVER